MSMQRLKDGAEMNGKVDPRIGIRKGEGGRDTMHPFNPNPFKAGGAQEQPFGGDTMNKIYEQEKGPSGGRKLRAEPVDQGAPSELGRKFGKASPDNGVKIKR